MIERQSVADDATLFMDDEIARLKQMITRVEALSGKTAANRSDDYSDRAKAMIELLLRRVKLVRAAIDRSQRVSLRSAR
ncbi:MAG: hypothetical protein LBC09_03805 [Helicobacteraceae bacterium]|jgi:hypothetical protein|nr:hypothetical protein [Helicobacteraceae bacterium]